MKGDSEHEGIMWFIWKIEEDMTERKNETCYTAIKCKERNPNGFESGQIHLR